MAVVVALACGGCGGSDTVVNPSEAPPQAVLEELGVVIKTMAEQKQKPPQKLADLDRYEPIAAGALAGLAKNKYVYVWGAGYKPGRSGIIAYETQAASSGGWVLCEDCTVKQLTAAEFGAAPKAK